MTPSSGQPQDATTMAQVVAQRHASAKEVVEEAIRRIESRADLNFLISDRFDEALSECARLPTGPLTGVPILLKDFLATIRGVRHTEGTRMLAQYVAPEDSEYVARLRRSGVVIIGTASTPEGALSASTEPELNGPAHNPWDHSKTTGGSSGGSASAVASCAVPVAHGNDAGGSIRIPSSCCGTFGLKPTRARNPLGREHGDVGAGIWVEHVLTRSVRDSAVFLDVTCGAQPGDPYVAPEPAGSFVSAASREPRPLRVAFWAMTPHGVRPHHASERAMTVAAEMCADLGHEVEEAAPNLEFATLERHFFEIFAAGSAQRVEYWGRLAGRAPDPTQIEPYTWAMYERGRRISAIALLDSIAFVQKQARILAEFFADYDLWLTPTLGVPQVPLGHFDPKGPDGVDYVLGLESEFCPYTWLANVSGSPAMSVPIHWDDDGLPVGAHFLARFGDEETLFSLAAQLERVSGWLGRVPPGPAAAK